MKFRILREDLLLPLQQVIGVIERRQTLPILANVLIEIEGDRLRLTGTDLEVQLVAHSTLDSNESGRFTVPARKLMDICRLLPDGGEMSFDVTPERVGVQCGRSRFALGALPAENYPSFEHGEPEMEFSCDAQLLKRAIEKTAFAMAQQDVRYYLNGLLLEVQQGLLRTVASDGHRLALFEDAVDGIPETARQIIMPRKGVLELARLLAHADEPARVQISPNNVRVTLEAFSFAAKLVEGRYPDYQRVIPRAPSRVVLVDRAEFKAALTRVAVLSNEKFKGVSLEIGEGAIVFKAQNPEHEEAEDEVTADVSGDQFSVGFNAAYLLDAVNGVGSDSVRMSFTDASGSCLIEDLADSRHRFIVMPMRL